MKNWNAPDNPITRRILLVVYVTALVMAFTVSLQQPAYADNVTPPPVPANIEVPAGNKATTFIQRVNTAGGVAPSTGCTSSADIGHQAFMPYTTDYFFYKKASEETISKSVVALEHSRTARV